jgi:flagellar assembly protein FliH
MKWSESIPLHQALRDVRLLTQAPMQDWNEHLREREQAAYERGRREGENSLGQQLIAQRNEIGGVLNGVLESLRNALPQIVQESENALIELALESARKIVADMPVNTKMVEAVVREALKQVEDTAEVTVQLHPEDLALLQKQKSKFLADGKDSAPLRLVGSPDVSRGGCLVQTRFGIIDARRETKFNQVREAMAV